MQTLEQNNATRTILASMQHELEAVRSERDRRCDAADAHYNRHLRWREEAEVSIPQSLLDENMRLHDRYLQAQRKVEKLEREVEQIEKASVAA